MSEGTINRSRGSDGQALLRALAALASGHRLRILAALAGERAYVSQLARRVRLSRPLVHMHLQRLEAAGLVSSHLKLSDDGKAIRYFEIKRFALHVTPSVIAAAVRTLEDDAPGEKPSRTKEDKR